MAGKADRDTPISRSHPRDDGDAEKNAASIVGDSRQREGGDVDGKIEAHRTAETHGHDVHRPQSTPKN